jgi:hypothetical protein
MANETLDNDLEQLAREDIVAEVKRLRAGIRRHRDSSGHDLCWHHPELWNLLPEKAAPELTVPEWPQFLRGCLRYRESLDVQLPHAPRVTPEFEVPAGPDDSANAGASRNSIRPPFTEETARRKVQAAEDAWNTRDPERVALAYSADSEWRNRSEFLRGRDEIRAFLRRKWAKELDYRLKKTLWGFRENRIAVSFEYEWHDASGQWFRSYGSELWEFDQEGLMRRRIASINDAAIDVSERRIH